MKASLDTNVIIHFYRAGLQNILFDVFAEDILVYEQIRIVELKNHGQDILKDVDADITAGKIKLITNQRLKNLSVYALFQNNVNENRQLYGTGDLGEVYAISLAQTLGAYSLVTDDIKQGGPYMSLLQFNDDVMPFDFTDVLLIRYLTDNADEYQTVQDFHSINNASDLNWSFRSHMKRFIRRFFSDTYREEDTEWIIKTTGKSRKKISEKLKVLNRLL